MRRLDHGHIRVALALQQERAAKARPHDRPFAGRLPGRQHRQYGFEVADRLVDRLGTAGQKGIFVKSRTAVRYSPRPVACLCVTVEHAERCVERFERGFERGRVAVQDTDMLEHDPEIVLGNAPFARRPALVEYLHCAAISVGCLHEGFRIGTANRDHRRCIGHVEQSGRPATGVGVAVPHCQCRAI